MKKNREPQYKHNAKGKPLSQPFPIVIENITGLRATHDVWPSYRGVFTGCSVLVSHHEDAQALHTMGCFGQASTPQFLSPGLKILRRRQFKTRRDWALLTAEQKLAQRVDDSDSSDSSEETEPIIITPKKRELYRREERPTGRSSSSRMKGNHKAVRRQWYCTDWDDRSAEREMICSEEEEQNPKKHKSVSDDEVVILSDTEEPAEKENSDPNQPRSNGRLVQDDVELVSIIEDEIIELPQRDDKSTPSFGIESMSPPNSPSDTPKKKSISMEDVSVIEQFLSSKNTVDLDSSSENGASSSGQKSSGNQEKQDSDSDDDFHLVVSGSDEESQNSGGNGSKSHSKGKSSEHSQDLFSSSEEECSQVESQDFKLQVSSDDSHPALEDGSQDFHLRVSSDETLDCTEVIELDGPVRSRFADESDEDEVVDLEEETSSAESSDASEMVQVRVQTNKRKRTHEEEVIVIADSDCEGDKSSLMAKWYPELMSAKDLQQNCDESLVLSLEEAFFLMKALGCLTIAAPASHIHRLLPPQPVPDPSRSPQPGPSGLQNFPNVAAVFGLHQLKDEKVLLTPEVAWQLFSITQESFASRYVIYHYFRAHNFVVRSGLKFGGDFLLYREGPSRTHASYVVLVVRQGSNSWQHVMTANRISETTRKQVLLSWVQWPESGVSLLNLQNVVVWEHLVSRVRPNRQLVELSSSEQDTDVDSE